MKVRVIGMKQTYYMFSNGTIKRKDNTLELYKEDGMRTSIPIERVDDIYIFSEITFNTKLIDFLSQYNVCVHFFNYYEYYSGTFYPRERLVSGRLLVSQVQHYENIAKRVVLAKKIIDAATYNIYRNIRYYNERGKELEEYIGQINSLRSGIPTANRIDELMGIEGSIRKIYYRAWNIIINQDINFEKRVRRPPDSMINSLISFLNSMVYTKTLGEIYKTQLNPTISYLHQPGTKRFSLSLDIAEIFKPLIADRLIFSLLNKNMIADEDFEKDQCYLKAKPGSLKKITEEFDKRMKTTIKHRSLDKHVSYQYLIRIELYKLIKHLLDEKEYEPFKIWW